MLVEKLKVQKSSPRRQQSGFNKTTRRVGRIKNWLGEVCECASDGVTMQLLLCAAAHSANRTCARPLNVLKFLGLRLSCFQGPDGRTFSSRGVQHVTICTFQFCKEHFVVHLFVFIKLERVPWFWVPKIGMVWGPRGWPPQCRLSCFV